VSSRSANAVLIACLVISASLCALRFNSFQVGSYEDDAHYIVLAESLATGRGYMLINYPQPMPEQAFPPGWPLMLAPVVALFPGNYAVLKLFSCLLWLGSLSLVYLLFRDRLRSPSLPALLALTAVNPLLVGAGTMVMSEAPYLFFSLLTLVAFHSWERRAGQKDGLTPWLLALMAFAAVWTQMIRTVGLSIMAAILLHLILTRRYRSAAIVTVIYFLALVPQFMLNSASGGSVVSAGYQAQVFEGGLDAKLKGACVTALQYADTMLANTLVPIFGPVIQQGLRGRGLGLLLPAINVLTVLLLAYGMIGCIRLFPLEVTYALCYSVSILSFWNPVVGSAQTRFLIPIIPFLSLFLIVGTENILSGWPERMRRARSALLRLSVTCLLVLSLARNLQDWLDPVRNRITDLSAGSSWIRENAEPDSLVMAPDPIPTYLYARRLTIPFPAECDQVHTYLRTNGVDYVLAAPRLQTPRTTLLPPQVEQCVASELRSYGASYEVVYSDVRNNVTVYRYVQSAPEP